MENITQSASAGITFTVDNSIEPIIELRNNGDIYIKGKLAETDKAVVDAMREFLKYSTNEE